MPLEFGYLRDLDEKPLTGCVLETRLDDTEFHGTYRGVSSLETIKENLLTTWVDENLGQTGSSSGTDFTPHSFTKVDDTRPDDEPPTQISQAMFGGIEREGRDVIRIN